MKTIRLIRIVAAWMFLLMLVTPSHVAATSATLAGHWTALDPIDGDTVHMTLGGGNDGVYQLSAFDIHAPGSCIETGGLGLLNGTATFDESTGVITKTVVASCPSEGVTYPENTLEMQYDPIAVTIYDHTFNLLYTR